MRLTVREIVLATEGRLERGDPATVVTGVSTDTRKDCEGALFVPLSGPTFDGREFIGAAFARGASAALCDRETPAPDGAALIKVDDARAALGKLAAWHRIRHQPLVVGVTGSVGKTTTKDMIALVLSKKHKTLKTVGNYNNDIGLPLTLFGLDETHTAAVLEMGMNHAGEIKSLSMIARPDIAVITNIGLAHVENLGSKRDILSAKYEIVSGLAMNGTLALNADDALLAGLRDIAKVKTMFFGIDETADVIGSNLRLLGDKGVEFEFSWQQRTYRAAISTPGAHNVHNALAAVAVGLLAGVRPDKIVEALAEYKPGGMRMVIATHAGVRVVNDSYNANPQSMAAALDVLAEVGHSSRKVAILGDMYELGAMSSHLHEEVGAYAACKGIDAVLAVGRHARDIAAGAERMPGERLVRVFADKAEAARCALLELSEGDVALVKGSRKMAMEDIANALEAGLAERARAQQEAHAGRIAPHAGRIAPQAEPAQPECDDLPGASLLERKAATTL